jgi:hypothetical protein
VEGLAASDDDVKITVMDTLIDGEDYRFQVFARDVAGNVFVTAVDTLSFTKAFANPTVDSFLVTIDSTSTSVDSVIAGVGLPLKVTAIDTKNVGELRTVVTFEQAGVLLCIDAGEQDTSGVSFSGEGVTDNGDGTAGLDGEGWMLGSRTVRVASNLTLDDFSVVVEDTSSQEQADPTGRLDSLTVDAAEFSQYQLSVLEEGVETAVVSGDFQITVLPIDAFGNPSTKVFIRAQDISSSDSLTASINLLQTRIPAGNVMDRIWVDFGTNIGDVEIPSGPQEVLAEGSTFTAVAPDREGEGLVIRVRAANEAPDTSGIAESQRTAAGVSKALSFIPFGEEPMVVTPAPPDTLVVHDYAGSDGKGDQGRYVLVTFPKSDDHGRIGQYRIYRELAVASAIGEDGKVVKGAEAVERFISWAVITPPPDTTEALVRAVVPSLDNKETRWAVAGEWGGAPTEPVPLGKPASSGPPLDIPRPPTAAGALGETVLPVPSEGTGSPAMATLEVGSIVQVQGFTDADDTVSLSARSSTGRSSVSKGGPSQTEGPAEAATKPIASTPKTISAPARAIDNLAPAAATEVSASAGDDGTVSLAWTPSADDRPVGLVTYRGFSMPIPGVEAYEVLRGPDAESLGRIATVDAGLKAFVDDAPLQGGMVYRVDALDLDNRSEGAPVGVSAGPTARPDWRDAEGNAVFIIDPNDGSPTEVDFGDFVALAQAFGSSVGDERYIALADTNDDGVINFTDFVAFATSFGRVAVTEDGEGI